MRNNKAKSSAIGAKYLQMALKAGMVNNSSLLAGALFWLPCQLNLMQWFWYKNLLWSKHFHLIEIICGAKKVVNFWTIFIQKQPLCQIYLLFLSPLFVDNLGAHHKASTLAIFLFVCLLFCSFSVLSFVKPWYFSNQLFDQKGVPANFVSTEN